MKEGNNKILNEKNIFKQEITTLDGIASNDNLKIDVMTNVKCTVVGEVIEFKIVVKNKGEIELKDIIIYSELAEQIRFLSETVKINNVPLKSANITSGIEIGDLSINESKILIFKGEILNSGNVGFITNAIFKIKKIDNIIECCETKSDLFVIQVKKAKLYMEKTSDLKEVGLGDVITYKVLIANDGNTNIINIIFKELIDKSTEFIEESFKVNDEIIINSVDLESGVRLGGLEADKIMDIEYKVKVIGTNSIGNIMNVTNVEYEYLLPCGICDKKSFEHKQVLNAVKLRISSFKQMTLETLLKIPECNPKIESVNEVKVEPVIKNYHLIETTKSISQEGQKITGYKLTVGGYIDVTLIYTEEDLTQGVHSAHYQVYFSDFVVLPSNFEKGRNVKVNAELEEIYHKVCNESEVYINPTVLLTVKTGNF